MATTAKIAGETVKLKSGEREYCWDGCGELASKGKRYKPGHDAKLASLLQSVADGGGVALKDTPLTVQYHVAKKDVLLPVAKWTTTTVTVDVTVRVMVGTNPKTALAAHVEKRKGWSVA